MRQVDKANQTLMSDLKNLEGGADVWSVLHPEFTDHGVKLSDRDVGVR